MPGMGLGTTGTAGSAGSVGQDHRNPFFKKVFCLKLGFMGVNCLCILYY